jgi:hypothetical protein
LDESSDSRRIVVLILPGSRPLPAQQDVMQVTVSEAASRDKNRTAVQAIEFEIR